MKWRFRRQIRVSWNFHSFPIAVNCKNSVFHRFLRSIPRQAIIVYRLIDAALIGNFSSIPSYFKIKKIPNVVHGPRMKKELIINKFPVPWNKINKCWLEKVTRKVPYDIIFFYFVSFSTMNPNLKPVFSFAFSFRVI